MLHFTKTLKTTALAGLFGLGFLAATASPALAHRVYTQCDNDGDRCWRVVCDDDGDDCRRVPIRTGWYRNDDDRSYWGNRDRDDWYRNRDHDRWDRRWVCDRDGDYCRWTERR